MPNQPYTDADLRHEAAQQFNANCEDPDFVGVGEGMDGEGPWADLDENDFHEAQLKVHNLRNNAAPVGHWAITLGAEGLTPDRQIVYRDEHGRATAAVHFAFDPDVVDVEKARKSLSHAVRHGLGYREA